MAMLGDLLASARREAGDFHRWVTTADPQLAGRMAEAAEAEGLSPAGYARGAVADFARFAAEEDWATLTSSLRDSPDPGTVCLLAMVHWRLSARTCRSHSPQQLQGALQ